MSAIIRPLDGVGLPQPPTGTLPALSLGIARPDAQGPVPQGYGRLIVVLRDHTGRPVDVPIALIPPDRGYLTTVVAGDPAGVHVVDVPAGTWTVTWPDDSTGAAQSITADIPAGHVVGFVADPPQPAPSYDGQGFPR